MNKRFLLSVVLACLLFSSSGCTRRNAPTEVAGAPAGGPAQTLPTNSPSLPAGESERSLTHAGRERSYILYVPSSVNWSEPVPLVFVFHGGTGNGQNAQLMSGFDQAADEHGFLVVYPNGTGRISDDKILTWNSGTCCGYALQENVDDVGFVRTMVADLQAQVNIDPKRIYATGLSNGAMMSHRLACDASDLFAAIAPVAGTLNYPRCKPSEPVSVIAFHGTADSHVLYDGGYGPDALVDVRFTSVPETMEFWLALDACASTPASETFSDIQHETWSGCIGSTAVELYTIIGGGHAWPGGLGGRAGSDTPTQTISATKLIWEFFEAHPKP